MFGSYFSKRIIKLIIVASLTMLFSLAATAKDILNKQEVTQIVQAQYPSKILKIKLKDSIYKVRFVTDKGRVKTILIDAYSGEILKQSKKL